MNTDVVLPNMGFGMEEGRLIAWLKQPGDAVRKGDALAEIESDKANVELEATVDGVLDAVLVPADQVVAVGTVLARIRPAGAAASVLSSSPAEPVSAETAGERGQRVSPVAQRLAREHGVDLAQVRGSGADGRVTREDVEALINRPTQNGYTGKALAAPAVRKLARDNGIDLNTLRGSGKDGHITRADVESALQAISAAPAVASVPVISPAPTAEPAITPAVAQEGRREISLTNMRQAIARRLAQSMQDAPHFYTTAELDFTAALAKLPKGVGVNALILYLTVKALQAQPELNATYENGHLYQYDHVDLAVAVALPSGLITPVLKRADDYSLSGLADRSRDLIERTRAGKLKPDELSGGTFTISNLGIVKQIDRFTAIINPPQVGILAVGAAKPRPVVIDGGLHVRTTAHLTVSADHRFVDGLLAARFLEAFDNALTSF